MKMCDRFEQDNIIRSKIRVDNQLTSKKLRMGGGFLVEEEDESNKHETVVTEVSASTSKPLRDFFVGFGEEQPICICCGKAFVFSYLRNNFEYNVCDGCHDPDDVHLLLTRTECKDTYLLKDCDLDSREPILPYIAKKNPHSARYADMKLYLLPQIEMRALEIWENWESLEQARLDRQTKRDDLRRRRFVKKVNTLRREISKPIALKGNNHVHSFGPEVVDDADPDCYFQICITCKYKRQYEKM